MLLQMFAIEFLFWSSRPAGTDDSNCVFVSFCPDNQNEASRYGTDRKESVFINRMVFIKISR